MVKREKGKVKGYPDSFASGGKREKLKVILIASHREGKGKS